MIDFYRIISKSPNYLRRFGLLRGLLLLSQIERSLPKFSNSIRSYKLPNYHAPIFLRDQTGDHAIFWQCLVLNQYDFRIFPQSTRFSTNYKESIELNRKILIIDCGANIGLATIWFAIHFPEAVIYAIEPNEENFEILRKNTSHFGERIKHLKGAIWNEQGTAEIINPQG